MKISDSLEDWTEKYHRINKIRNELNRNENNYNLAKCGDCNGNPIFTYNEKGYYIYCVDCQTSIPGVKTDMIAVDIWNKLSEFYKTVDKGKSKNKSNCVCGECGSGFYSNFYGTPENSKNCLDCNLQTPRKPTFEEAVFIWNRTIEFLKEQHLKEEVS